MDYRTNLQSRDREQAHWTYLLLDLEFPRPHDRPLYVVQCQLKLELLNRFHIHKNTNIGVLGCPRLLQNTGNLDASSETGQALAEIPPTSPNSVFSNRPLTIRAEGSLSGVTSLQLMIGVLITLAALIISLIRGTPRVTFIDATPAKWKVLSVIWVPGSPMDWAPTAPTVEPTHKRQSPL